MSIPTFSGYTGMPWDGTPLADGAYIALQSTGYAALDVMGHPDGSFHPLSSFIGTTPLAGSVFGDKSMTATMDYLVAPLPASNAGSVFRVTTWPHVAGEQYGYATNYQKLILQGPSGKYVEIAQGGPSGGNNYSVSASQANARVFLLSPLKGGQGVLFDAGYTYGQRATIEPDNFHTATCGAGVFQLTICQMPFLPSPLGQIIQGKTNSGSLNVFVMTPPIVPTTYDSRLDDPRVFDATFYLKCYPDLTAAFGTNFAAAHEHWVTVGFAREGRRGSRAFDAQFYLAHYADLKAAFGSNYMAALAHWLSPGLPKEGRAGSVEFDPQYYLAAYADLKAAFGTNYNAALDHWLTFGIKEGRKGAA